MTGRQTGMVGQIFPVGFARNGHLVPIKQIVVHHEFDHARCPTNVLHILHDVPTRGLEIRQEWNLYKCTKTDSNGILKGTLGHNIIHLEQPLNGLSGWMAFLALFRRIGRGGRRIRQRHAFLFGKSNQHQKHETRHTHNTHTQCWQTLYTHCCCCCSKQQQQQQQQ